jgi:hypothetical protein
MAGYATGEVFFVSQALGFRHSHLDSGGYAYDQKHGDREVEKAQAFLIKDEASRVLLTSMVSCLLEGAGGPGIYGDFAAEICSGYLGLGQGKSVVPGVNFSGSLLAKAGEAVVISLGCRGEGAPTTQPG